MVKELGGLLVRVCGHAMEMGGSYLGTIFYPMSMFFVLGIFVLFWAILGIYLSKQLGVVLIAIATLFFVAYLGPPYFFLLFFLFSIYSGWILLMEGYSWNYFFKEVFLSAMFISRFFVICLVVLGLFYWFSILGSVSAERLPLECALGPHLESVNVGALNFPAPDLSPAPMASFNQDEFDADVDMAFAEFNSDKVNPKASSTPLLIFIGVKVCIFFVISFLSK